jgi:hypothetical protein
MQIIHRIELKVSRILALVLIGLHIMSIVIVWQLPIAGVGKWLVSLACLSSLAYYMSRDCLHILPSSIRQLWQDTEGQWLLLSKQGHLWPAQLLGTSFVRRYLVILNFKVLGKVKAVSVLLLPDIIHQDQLRRLRIQLMASAR